MKRFLNKVALITGGTSGMGKATALKFAKEGAIVIICGRNEEKGDEVLKNIIAFEAEGVFFRCDVSKDEDVRNMFIKITDKFGRIDYAFNNAGISSKKAMISDSTEENWDNVIDINLKGVWLCMKYEISQMLENNGGVIINNSSAAGLYAVKNIGAYVASKFGVVGLSKAAALEYADSGIRINVICPGFINTEMTDKTYDKDPALKKIRAGLNPLNRLGEVEDIANAVAWLCSDEASYLTGLALPIDGGYLAGENRKIN